jgi:steroid 5-alpha reductase family enzyme
LWKSFLGKNVAEGGFWDYRQILLSAAVTVWATRLGTYLFSRISSDNGQDSRFEKIRVSPPKFFAAFMAQATWVSLCLLPVAAVNALPPVAFNGISRYATTSILGLALFVFGFTFEVIADRQKSLWMTGKREKKHSEEFLTRGLWSKSRHPNYFGEITLWTGLAVTAGGLLASNAGQHALGWSGSPAARLGAIAIAAASPAFTTFLLTQVSGVPLSERKYDKKYGDRKDYREWKENTPVLIPKLF